MEKNNINKHVVILKNDAVGDLVHSLNAIYNIVNDNKNIKTTIFLSKLSEKFAFLIKNPKIEIKILNYDLSLIEKIEIFKFLLINKIEKLYILSPKNYYFFLPLFFKKTKFYAICINGVNNYRSPVKFLRKFLFKYEINDREIAFKRNSTKLIQHKLTSKNDLNDLKINTNYGISDKLLKYLPNNYIYFHLKKKIFDELGWGLFELKNLFKKFNNYYPNIVLTKDIEVDENTVIFKENFNTYNIKSNDFKNNNSKVTFFDNLEGSDLYNVIKLSQKVVAFHGMMTNLASIEKKPVLDLFYCKINSWEDYRKYRNSFYEFKPKYKGYDFIIPSKDINKTLNKITFSFK